MMGREAEASRQLSPLSRGRRCARREEEPMDSGSARSHASCCALLVSIEAVAKPLFSAVSRALATCAAFQKPGYRTVRCDLGQKITPRAGSPRDAMVGPAAEGCGGEPCVVGLPKSRSVKVPQSSGLFPHETPSRIPELPGTFPQWAPCHLS